MIKFKTTNLHTIDPKHGVSESQMREESGKIAEYLEKIEARGQGFYTVIDNEDVLRDIQNFADRVKGKYDDIVVLGIGGSSLGGICLQQSLKHLFENEKPKGQWPKLHVLDNIDPAFIAALEDIIDYEKTLFIPITKSGSTPETLSQYFYFRNTCNEKGLSAQDHFAFITDPERGLLRKIAREEGIPAFEIPENVGGRFSVLTPVGLLPAALIGINIHKLIEGAKTMRDQFISENFEKNLPFQMATLQYALAAKGKIINVMIPYCQRLVRFADWYRQLLAESIGKRVNENGEVVHTGITPINALGVTDQHSQSQLYNEGPNDKFFIFIDVKNLGPKLNIPNLFPEEPIVDYIKDVDFGKLMHIEKQGTEGALTQNDRPNMSIIIDDVNEETLGGLFMLFEGSTAFLGELYNINAFDQPGVELSKNITKELLRGS